MILQSIGIKFLYIHLSSTIRSDNRKLQLLFLVSRPMMCHNFYDATKLMLKTMDQFKLAYDVININTTAALDLPLNSVW